MNKPKVFKENEGKSMECGCCFRTCGGSPAIQGYSPSSKSLDKKLAKIK